MRIVFALVILLLGVLLGVLLAKGLFTVSTITGVSVIVLAVLLGGFFLARDGVRWARKRWGT
jgi:ABC-type multidrug transport system permease subunit